MSRRAAAVSASPVASQLLKPLSLSSSRPVKAKRKAGQDSPPPQPTAEQLAATSFLASYQSSVAASTALLSSLSSQTAAALTAASAALMQIVERRRREREVAELRRESRVSRRLQEEEWRAEQEREVLLRCVDGRREEERRRERERQERELERDRRCYQQQQEVFEREVQRMREQEQAELQRERQQEQQRCTQRMRSIVMSIVGVAHRRRLWSELTERADVEPELWENWMQLMRQDRSALAITGDTETQPQQTADAEAETAGDGLNAAITSSAFSLPPPASAPSQLPALSPPQTAAQPAASPSHKKGRGERKEEAAAAAPPAKTLPELRLQYSELLDLHRHAHSTALALREADHKLLDAHFASFYASAPASFSSAVADSSRSFSALVQHVEAKATAPPLPVALPFLPHFPIRLALLGKPYSGKRTQAERLAAHYGLSVIAVADIVASQQELQQMLASSTPLPESLLVSLVAARIAALPASCPGFLLLSFPSSLPLARLLSVHTPWPLTAVLELRVGEERIRRRCLARCIDAEGREWGREENSADADSLGKAELRPADRGERLMKQCRQYEREREAMQDWWATAGNRREVDGEGSRDDVFSALCAHVDQMLAAAPPPPIPSPVSAFAPLLDAQLARLLFSHHQRASAGYAASLSVFSSSLRQLRIAVVDRLHTARLCLRRLLHCESRANQWHWQLEADDREEEEEGERAAEMLDAAWKEEQHMRAEEAGRRLRESISSRRREWEQELQDVRGDGWELSMRATLVRCHVRMMQAEADRWLAAVHLTRDFYRSRAGRTLQEDDSADAARYSLQAGLQPRRQLQKDEKAVAAAGKDKTGGKKTATAATSPPEEAGRDAAQDPLGDAVRQCETIQREAKEAALQGLEGDDEGERQQAEAVLASLCSNFSFRVLGLEQRGKAAVAALEEEVACVMAALEAEASRRWEQEEAEVADWLRWLQDQVEAEEQPVWEVRRRQATQPGLLVDRRRRLQQRRPEVMWSVWEKRQQVRESEEAATRQTQSGKLEEEAKQQTEGTVEEAETGSAASVLTV